MLNIVQKFLRLDDDVRSGINRASTQGFTVHYTGNAGSGIQGNWNYFNGGVSVNSTFMIGLNGECWQLLPLDERPWTNGDVSNGWSVTVETCHPDSTGEFSPESLQTLIELAAYVCNHYDLDPMTDIYRHSDFVNTDCPRWYTGHPDRWYNFKKSVKDFMENGSIPSAAAEPTVPNTGTKTIAQLAQEVLNGKYGNGEDRKQALGVKYDTVQTEVERILNSPKPIVKPKYNLVEVAKDVMQGKYGNGDARKMNLNALGLNYNEVQSIVNKLVDGEDVSSYNQVESTQTRARKANSGFANIGENCVTTDDLNVRTGPGTEYRVRLTLPEGTRVKVMADGGQADGHDWLKVQYPDPDSGELWSDYVAAEFLR